MKHGESFVYKNQNFIRNYLFSFESTLYIGYSCRALKYLWNVLSQENHWEDYYLWLEQKFIKDCLNKNQPMLLFIGYLLSKMITDHYRYYETANLNRKILY